MIIRTGKLEKSTRRWKRERERMDSERVTKPCQVYIQLPLQT